MTRSSRSLCGLVLALTALSALGHETVLARQAPREVPGTEAPRGDSDRVGDAGGNSTMSVAVTLPLRNSAELDRLISRVSDPASPDHGRYLTNDQFKERFAPTQQAVTKVTDYLRSQGLRTDHVSDNNLVIDASGRAGDLGRAFGTSLGRYHDRRTGRDYVANDGPVAVAPDVAPEVLSVVGLDNHYAAHPHLTRPLAHPNVGGGPGGGYTPAQLRSAYDLGPLAAAGFTGAGQNIGLLELDGFSQSNISTFDQYYGLGSPAPTVRQVDGGSGPLGAGQNEVELDIEVLHAIAPAAAVTVWEGPNTDQGIIDIYNAMATANVTPKNWTNSTSWGLCEAQTAPSFLTSEDNVFKQASVTGHAFFAASGDAGAYDCGDTNLGVDNPAGDPYVTGVGGTNLKLSSANVYSSESAWSNPAAVRNFVRGEGSGGGISSKFSRPTWQAAPGVPSNGSRLVPDVSTNADPGSGYSIYTTGQWGIWGGTSAAAPMWAALATLYNQNAAQAGKPPIGFADPALYSLASQSQPYPPFHDVTSGNNLYYQAGAAWDYPTGLGTPDAYNLTRDLLGTGVPPGAPVMGSAVAGDGQATVSFSPPASTGGSAISSYTVTSSPGGATASGAGSPLTVAGLTNGTSYTFTVTATNGTGTGPPSAASNPVTPRASAFHYAESTLQYVLSGSDGSSWVTMDAANLTQTLRPSSDTQAIVDANADLFTSAAGINQDIGIFVSDNGAADRLLAWKESGGFAGTYSPNAAFVQGVQAMTAGHTYKFSLKWKTNTAQRAGTVIYAGAGAAAPYSPTRLTVEALPTGSTLLSGVSTQQYQLSGNDGTAWANMDVSNLTQTLTPGADTAAILGANVDLFTDTTGINQDVGIFVSDNGAADQLVAWKESGGFAGTFSPNAAFVQSVFPMTGGHSYAFSLKWKTNHAQTSGSRVFAGAGASTPYSPTRLTVEVPASPIQVDAVASSQQYTLSGNNGTSWVTLDATTLVRSVTPGADTIALVGGNVDLFTSATGFNQDIGIFVSDGGGPDQLVAWKESGGFAGTYSPNAAFVQGAYPVTAGHTYTFKLKWKTNVAETSGATIYAAAGAGAPYSPTRLSLQTG